MAWGRFYVWVKPEFATNWTNWICKPSNLQYSAVCRCQTMPFRNTQIHKKEKKYTNTYKDTNTKIRNKDINEQIKQSLADQTNTQYKMNLWTIKPAMFCSLYTFTSTHTNADQIQLKIHNFDICLYTSMLNWFLVIITSYFQSELIWTRWTFERFLGFKSILTQKSSLP